MDTIIFVGDKPSEKNKDPNVAFVGTQSYKRLLDWIWRMDIDISNVKMYNKGAEDVGIYANFARKGIIDCKFVALGKEAEKHLNWLEIRDFFSLPHPSGLNRQNNDEEFVKERLDLCKKWLEESCLKI